MDPASTARALLATVVALIAFVAGGCDEATPSPVAPPPVAARAEDHGFVLDVRLPSTAFAEGEAIPIATTLTWTGPAEQQTVWGSGSGVVQFLYRELTGRKRSMGGVMTADCALHDFARGVPVEVPIGKSWGASADDPDFAFYQQWGSDPLLHLPAGSWQVDVDAGGYLAPCDQAAPSFDVKIQILLTIG